MYASDITQVPLDFFLRSLLHPLSYDVPETQALLASHGHIVKGRWNQLVDWVDTKERTGKILQDFSHIFDAVAGVLEHLPSVRFIRAAEVDDASHFHPDAEFRLSTSDTEVTSFARAVPWHSSGGTRPNEARVIASCHAALRDDARRRFSFGISTDRENMRIWFFSRSHEFVTPPFSFLTDPQNVLHLLLALMTATPEELGYDSTISYFLDDHADIQYKISVDETTYITKKMLADNRADTTCGRASRVWEAFREDDADCVSVIVKDVWIPVDAVPEGAHLLDLHSRLRKLVEPGTPRPPQDYFLTVLAHGFVKTSSGSDDSTLDFIHGCVSPPQTPGCSPRKHYRVVFKEVGVAAEALESVSDLLRALADATQALRLLHLLGFVHRDVSAGNIILVDGVGKLSDLEYLKSFKGSPSPNCSDCRIGTPEYTSIEVVENCYLYCCLSLTPDPDVETRTEPPFWFNPLHDLESLMWIALFAISYHRRRTSPAMRCVLDTYFPPHFCSQTTAARLFAIRSRVLPVPPSDPLSPVATTLDSVRAHLFSHYMQYGKEYEDRYFAIGNPSDRENTPFGQLHSTLFALYEKAIVESEGIPLAIPDPAKRKASQEVPATPETRDSGLSSPRPSKKSKSTSPKAPGPSTTRSSHARTRRSPNVTAPSRRSLRLAEKRKTSKEGRKSWT